MDVFTYEDYINEPQGLTFERMNSIHQSMKEEIGRDPEALELYQDLLKTAAEYGNVRSTWYCMSREERAEKNSGRTSKHNSLIKHLNMLARYLQSQGHPASWRDEIATEEEGYGRKAIGDFGCYLAFVYGLSAR